MSREVLFETDLYVAEGEFLETDGKYHIWVYPKKPFINRLTEEQVREIEENIKDFGKWKKFKKLSQELEGK